MPEELMGDLLVPYSRVKEDALYLSDMYCDELFDYEGVRTFKAEYNRYICDVERFPDDAQEEMAKKGQGLYYTHLFDGSRFRGAERRDEIKEKVYDKFHQEFSDAVGNALRDSSRCLIIDCHSFPDDLEGRGDLPDICFGSSDYHTPHWLLDAAIGFIRDSYGALDVKVNDPFSGAIVPAEYFRNNENVCSVMIELNRRLYMSPGYIKSEGFQSTKKLCKELIGFLIKNFKGGSQ